MVVHEVAAGTPVVLRSGVAGRMAFAAGAAATGTELAVAAVPVPAAAAVAVAVGTVRVAATEIVPAQASQPAAPAAADNHRTT